MSGSVAALFQRLTQGVYVVGVAHGEVRNAFTAAWAMQVSFDLSVGLEHQSTSFVIWATEGRPGVQRQRTEEGPVRVGIQHQLARFRSDHMVDFRYDSGSFSHGRRNALGGARPHIADGENTGSAGLKG